MSSTSAPARWARKKDPKRIGGADCPRRRIQCLRNLALLWQIFRGHGLPKSLFLCLMGGRFFGGADHGSQNVGLERRAWPLAQAVSGSVGSQGTATNVPALRVGTDRSWRSQEHSADGEAACAGRMRPIAPLH